MLFDLEDEVILGKSPKYLKNIRLLHFNVAILEVSGEIGSTVLTDIK